MSTDTYPINPALLAPVEPTRNPPVQISDEFIMPSQVATRLLTAGRITNTMRKRCKRAMQTAVVSRAPILQEMKSTLINRVITESIDKDRSYVVGTLKLEKADRVYDASRAGKTFDVATMRRVRKMNMKQLLQKAARIPAKRAQAQWAALHGRDMCRRQAAEQRVNMLDEMLDAIETEVARRVL